jgi:hypothetical protein
MQQTLPTLWSEREVLRNKGQFWTPSWVAEAMVAYVMNDTDLIFDPATGTGAFFKAMLKLQKANTYFYGTDTDDGLLLADIYQNEKAAVEKRDFVKNPPVRKFKSIVTNPPYIRHHRLDPETKAFLRQLSFELTGKTIDGRAGYHVYFLIRALSLLEEGGKLAIIMSADTCEGHFAADLWKWISANYCLECVITFAENATPFPGIDTNAMIFLIKNAKPANRINWVKVSKANSNELLNYVLDDFKMDSYSTLNVIERDLDEAITTGLSRPQNDNPCFKYRLSDFATVMRGIATGANDFFFLTSEQIEHYKIPDQYLKRAVGRTRDIADSVFTKNDLAELDKNKRPTFLLSLNDSDEIDATVADYLKIGEELGLPNRSLISQRTPWYKMERRNVPPILFAYLGRRNSRFIMNSAGVLPLTGFLCLYPIGDSQEFVNNLWQALNHADTLKNLNLVGKSYGGGAIKVEPSKLAQLPISEDIVEKYGLLLYTGYKREA